MSCNFFVSYDPYSSLCFFLGFLYKLGFEDKKLTNRAANIEYKDANHDL